MITKSKLAQIRATKPLASLAGKDWARGVPPSEAVSTPPPPGQAWGCLGPLVGSTRWVCTITAPSAFSARAEPIDSLWSAILRADAGALAELWGQVPSFGTFVEELSRRARIRPGESCPVPDRALPTYVALAEVAAVALEIADEGIYYAGKDPPALEFARAGYEVYRGLAHSEDEYVPVGAWLEALVRNHSIHPIRARSRLEEARVAGYLDRFTEGSTPETRFERHSFSMLSRRGREPSIEQVHLYHGDFLIAGRASVSVRLQLKGAV